MNRSKSIRIKAGEIRKEKPNQTKTKNKQKRKGSDDSGKAQTAHSVQILDVKTRQSTPKRHGVHGVTALNNCLDR